MARNGDGVELRENSIRIAFTYKGERHRETLTINGRPLKPTTANVKLAHRMRQEVQDRIDRGTFDLKDYFPDSKRLAGTLRAGAIFGEACAVWLDTKRRLAPHTITQYRNAIERWKRLLGADTLLADIGHAKLAGVIGKTRWASNKLLNNNLIPLRGVMKLGLREGWIKSDPTDGIENTKHQAPGPDPLTADEAAAVVGWLGANGPMAAYYLFAFATGLRPEEQIALRWSDIDMKTGTARLARARTGGVTGPLKTYEARDIDLNAAAKEALMLAAGNAPSPAIKEVFWNPTTGKALHDERTPRDHFWKPALKALGIRPRRAYCTRHTFATLSLMHGTNPVYIARQMGHKHAQMLFKVYAKWIDNGDKGRERAKSEGAFKGLTT